MSTASAANAAITEADNARLKVLWSFLQPEENEDGKTQPRAVTAPPQQKKTYSIIDLIKMSSGFFSALSCDDSITQMNQMKRRIEDMQMENEIFIYELGSVNVMNVALLLKRNCKVVIVLLNNATQVAKLHEMVKSLVDKGVFSKYLCIHDEGNFFFKSLIIVGDMVNKSSEVFGNPESQQIRRVPQLSKKRRDAVAEVHKQWVAHFLYVDSLAIKDKLVRRIFVTATPENCFYLQQIKAKHILVLPVPDGYCCVNEHVAWGGFCQLALSPGKSPKKMKKMKDVLNDRFFNFEIERTRGTREAVLCCSEALNVNQNIHALEVSKKNCVCISYNCNGIVVYCRGEIVYNEKGKGNKRQKILAIDQVLTDIVDGINQNEEVSLPVVIFGSMMMDRGISFVGYGSNPITASVMFYSGGAPHAVLLVQKFGRICGTSNPGINIRRVYCLAKHLRAYQAYYANQEAVARVLKDHPDETVSDIFKGVPSEPLGVNADRKVLGKFLVDYNNDAATVPVRAPRAPASSVLPVASAPVAPVSVTPPIPVVSAAAPVPDVPVETADRDQMIKFVKKWMQEDDHSLPGKIFKSLTANGGSKAKKVLQVEFANQNVVLSSHTRGNGRNIFGMDKTMFFIKDEALAYCRYLYPEVAAVVAPAAVVVPAVPEIAAVVVPEVVEPAVAPVVAPAVAPAAVSLIPVVSAAIDPRVAEEWREIPAELRLTKYQVSTLARVRRKGKADGVVMNCFDTRDGFCVNLRMDNGAGKQQIRIHRLMCLVFIPNPENKKYAIHLDGDIRNNSLDNLAWR